MYVQGQKIHKNIDSLLEIFFYIKIKLNNKKFVWNVTFNFELNSTLPGVGCNRWLFRTENTLLDIDECDCLYKI